MKKIKTLLYLRADITFKPLKAGGSISHTLGVLEGFLNANISIVCAITCMSEYVKKLPLTGLQVLSIPSYLCWLRWKINCILSNIYFLFPLRSLLCSHAVDYIYQRYTLLNVLGIILQWWYQIPLILEYNGSEVWAAKEWGRKNWFQLRWLSQLVEVINIRYASYIVVVSDVLKEELLQRGRQPDTILVNPNGVNTHLYNPVILANDREKIRTKFDMKKSFVFGFVSTFEQFHGTSTLEKVLPKIISFDSSIRCLLIGDGPQKLFLESSLKPYKNIIFTGLMAPDKARSYLAACDAFLCPTQVNKDSSRFFGSPTKLFEYMSLGKPIVAFDVEQIADILSPLRSTILENKNKNEEKKVGYLVPSQNDELFNEVCITISKPSSAEKNKIVGTNAREKACAYYTWDAHVQSIIRWVEKEVDS